MAYNNVLFILWDGCAISCHEQLEPIMTWKTQWDNSAKKTTPMLKSPLGSAIGIFQKISPQNTAQEFQVPMAIFNSVTLPAVYMSIPLTEYTRTENHGACAN